MMILKINQNKNDTKIKHQNKVNHKEKSDDEFIKNVKRYVKRIWSHLRRW